MKKITLALVASVMAGLALLALPLQATITAGDITGGAIAPHVNVAIFHKLHGHDDFVYPENIDKNDILQATAGKAQFVLINHTAGVKDGDVITMSNDVLREGSGDFEDFGVDCQISLHINGTDVTLAGMCQILMIDQDYRQINHKGTIKPITIHESTAWQLVYYDAEDGVAVYVNEEVGLE
ncbi:MAG: hypothetical protein Q9M10_07955 [Mariprofundaceae bacterium]|nr:hypothetical protein [Mariprofundaceae bacterium]